MSKKIPAAVRFFGLIYIITSPVGFFANISYLIKYSTRMHFSDILTTIVFIILNALAFLIGLNILRLKESWRKINLYYCLFMVVYFIINLFFRKFAGGDETTTLYLIFYIISIFYFTRRRIKAQFK